jgi:hypothetical protein
MFFSRKESDKWIPDLKEIKTFYPKMKNPGRPIEHFGIGGVDFR